MYDDRLSRLVAALSDPAFHPERPKEVAVEQTHISWVFLAGDLVYKVKKPVRFSFLDYSTLARRLHFCREEVRLNRRLAPSVYLGVVPVLERAGAFSFGDEDCEPADAVEYAVRMRRLPRRHMLDRLIEQCRAGAPAIERLATRLVTFHAAASRDGADTYGSAEAVERVVLGNLGECRDHVGETLSDESFRAIEGSARAFLRDHRPLLGRRAQDGWIREGHGDLRAEHVCLEDEISIFDAIEFSRELRVLDVASEIAFLAMDLDVLGAPRLGRDLTERYAASAGDEGLAELLPLYLLHRASVRGKVESLRGREAEVAPVERERSKQRARRFFRVARRYAAGAPPPAVIAVAGLAGSGKSTLARGLADATGFQWLRSDVVRKRIAGIEPTVRGAELPGLYGEPFTRLVYDTLVDRARDCLAGAFGVIVDATFREAWMRRPFLELESRRIPVLFVECRTDEREIARRMSARTADTEEVSDATWEEYLRTRDDFAPFDGVAPEKHLVVDGGGDMDAAVGRVEHALAAVR
jgi:aminoglycoside phosphotransferase family enzyme/predicted kinase